MEDEETESSAPKSELIREPDLLSDVSEMKQDLIKMTAILTADATEKSSSLSGCGLEKGTEDVSGEPLEIMEKDLERVKEDLEKVSEILRSGTYQGEVTEDAAKAARMAEEWVLLSDNAGLTTVSSFGSFGSSLLHCLTSRPLNASARSTRAQPRSDPLTS
ncbi:unnamed protein product [Menidia menidia]|uniref:(Atlantic silverside) hypothetical protein n=1 Tax=Menidia menidia TaxID=238744 RepID=A0A8S4BAG7_9TELE|nr:unnamed protein product [Menidia menidia]